jgi:hypothetical protein
MPHRVAAFLNNSLNGLVTSVEGTVRKNKSLKRSGADRIIPSEQAQSKPASVVTSERCDQRALDRWPVLWLRRLIMTRLGVNPLASALTASTHHDSTRGQRACQWTKSNQPITTLAALVNPLWHFLLFDQCIMTSTLAAIRISPNIQVRNVIVRAMNGHRTEVKVSVLD